MKRFLRWTGRALLGLLGLVVLTALGLAGAVWWTLPARHGEVALPGLSAPVEIPRRARHSAHPRR